MMLEPVLTYLAGRGCVDVPHHGPGVRGDDRPGEHTADRAGVTGADNDSRSVDSLQRPESTLCCTNGGSRGRAKSAMTPA